MGNYDIELPCFHGTTSIEIDTPSLGVKPLPDGEFTVLESLSIKGRVMDLRSLLKRCPRLRALSISHRDMHLSHETLPPANEFPPLEKLSLSGKIVDLGPLLNNCNRLQELRVKQREKGLLHIKPPPSGEFPVLERLSLSGNINNIGNLLNRCPRLSVLAVKFHGMGIGSIEAGLSAIKELGIMVSLLAVQIPWRDDVDAARFNSLLCTIGMISPHELIFTESYDGYTFSKSDSKVNVDLPCSPRVSSIVIKINLRNVCFTMLPSGEFLALKRLSLSGHSGIIDIGTLVTLCPCLQVLYVYVFTSNITVHSVSLQKLYVSHWEDGHNKRPCHNIDIVTPMLKELTLNVHAAKDMGVSISAPTLDKISWRSTYTPSLALLFGSWRLAIMSVRTKERSNVDKRVDTCLQQLPQFDELSLHLNAGVCLSSVLFNLPKFYSFYA
jgi:hypothetical protein